MEEDRCFRCDRSKEEVRLLDAVYGNELVKVCEECSLVENIPIIRKPSSSQLQESEKPFSVRQRLNRMAGLKDEREETEKIAKITKNLIANITLDNLRKPKDYSRILDEKFKLAKKRNVPVNLIDNFNWSIMMERKKRKIDRKQLADSVGESETVIRMIENKEMPDDYSRIISKIEQYFGIKLRKENVEENRAREAIKERLNLPNPARVLSFDKEIAKNITIADLKKMREFRENQEKEMKKVDTVVWGRNKTEDKAKEEKNDGASDLLGSDIEFEEN